MPEFSASDTNAPVLLIAGDVAPMPSDLGLFGEADVRGLLGEELAALWLDAGARVINLESPLCDADTPILKYGPHLRAPTAAGAGIAGLRPTVVGLANNHVLDHGAAGLESTRTTLERHGLAAVGAGRDATDAARSHTLRIGDRLVGIHACCDTEFSGATATSAGAHLFDPLTCLGHIAELRTECDHVVVLHHGGKEGYRYPTPHLQRMCRRMVESGADLVVCQHSHCIGCAESWRTGTIVYGQGNFIFDGSEDEFWQTGLLIRAVLGDRLTIEYVPLEKRVERVRLAVAGRGQEILDAFRLRSEQILVDGFVEAEWEGFCGELLPHYLRAIGGFGTWLARIDRRLLGGRLVRHRYPTKALLVLQNYLQCDAHRELILTGIAARLRECDDRR